MGARPINNADASPQLFVQAGCNMCFSLVHLLHVARSPGVRSIEAIEQNCLVPDLILDFNLCK